MAPIITVIEHSWPHWRSWFAVVSGWLLTVTNFFEKDNYGGKHPPNMHTPTHPHTYTHTQNITNHPRSNIRWHTQYTTTKYSTMPWTTSSLRIEHRVRVLQHLVFSFAESLLCPYRLVGTCCKKKKEWVGLLRICFAEWDLYTAEQLTSGHTQWP